MIKAQEYLLKGDFKSALHIYKEVVSSYYKYFPHECVVGAQMAALLQDTSSMRFFLVKGAKAGISIQMVHTLSHCNSLFKEYADYKISVYNEISRSYKYYLDKVINNKFKQIVDSTLKLDALAKQEFAKEERVISNRASISSNHAYTRVLDNNINCIINYVKQYGFVGQNESGYDIFQYNRPAEWIILNSTYLTLFYHQEYGFQFLEDTLLAAVYDGRIRPSEYALLHDWSYEWLWNYWYRCIGSTNYFDFTVKTPFKFAMRKYNKSAKAIFHCNDLELVDKDRELIGLCSLKHEKKLRAFSREHSIVMFFGQFSQQ